jgi:NTE family protein
MGQNGRTALVLSAGGMFGAYQAGVWQELAQVFQPDIVVGASVGALNGWEIACATDPADLTRRWLALESLAAIRWRIPASPADGLLDAAALEEWIRAACSGRQPCREFGAVLTRVPDLKPTLFRTPDITWKHIAGSCAVPGFLRHHRIGGCYYTDGGIVDPLPVWAAVEMGATAIVTVNVLKHRPWFIRFGVRALRRWACYSPASFDRIRLVDVSPSGRLGTARDSMYWSREKVSEWIERGRRDAQHAKTGVVECLRWAASNEPGENATGWPSIVSTV